jgi:amino acid adenylation domain-containing protein
MTGERMSLTPEKRSLLEQLLRKEEGGRPTRSLPRIPPRPPVAPGDAPLVFPQSFAQQRLWFLEQFAPGTSVYNVPTALRWPGPLNVAALERALNEILRRHEVLRTTFSADPEGQGTPVQVVVPSLDLPLTVADLTSVPAAAREAEAARVSVEEFARPFDLSRGPLLRALLLRLDDADHVLALTLHHIVTDGWSMGVLLRELGALYAAFAAGRPSPLPDLEIQYADFACWQRRWLQGELLESHLAYWRSHLEGAPAVLELPTDRPRPPVVSFRGATQALLLPPELTRGLEDLSRCHGVTLFMTLLAAFSVLLHRYSGQDDVVVGTPIAGRTRAEVEPLIGFFVNTLVLRTSCAANPRFEELLGRVRETTLGAYAHQDLPFEKLVEELQPERALSYNPLFQVMLVLQNTPQAGSQDGAAASEASPLVPTGLGTSKFDLTLALARSEEGLAGIFEYSTDLFDAETISTLATHFRTLVESVVADPATRLWDLELLSAEERHRLVVDWNRTACDLPATGGVQQMFEARAAATPSAPALAFGEQVLTYDELNRRANRLAHRLRGLGVAPETRVGIFLPRSVEMIVAVLGVLKAGGAYVPLDPAYPLERLRFMAADAGVSVLLAETGSPPLVSGQPTVLVTGPGAGGDLAAETNPEVVVLPDNLAYVLYTSGSTGRPKGVMVTHRGLPNLAWALAETFSVGAGDRVLQVASLSFDASVFEIVMAFDAGATLELAAADALLPGPGLSRLLADRRINVVTLRPSALAVLVPGDLPDLRTLVVAGERLPGDLAATWSRTHSVYNAYGPTETTIWSTTAPPGAQGPIVPIGRPIANTQIYLIGRFGELVPTGVPGELCIGGVGLARGYLNRPDLTAERFVPNPFSGGGERLYRTGDLARYRHDGTLEFLGRLDDQVKIRGFRVELGEVEAVLGQHPDVRDAAVVAREDPNGERRLVAYVVAREAATLTTSALAAFLREHLPVYMLPSAFVVLDALPLTPNGKIDRRGLPSPESTRPILDEPFTAPRSSTEEVLAAIWADVLGLDRVGVLDNFFEIGGHSLLATQVVSRIRDLLDVELELRRLFETPTVAGLAALIDDPIHLATAEEMEMALAHAEAISEAEAEKMLAQASTTPGTRPNVTKGA